MGDWADDMLAGGGVAEPEPDWADALLAQPSPDADGFASWQKPGDAGSQKETSGSNAAGAPQWSGGSSFGDGAYSAAGGVFSGIGVNPRSFGPDVAASLQMAQERSPKSAAVGKLAGEVGIQSAALPAKALGAVATGVASGALSGFGNSEGSAAERGQATLEGGLIGGVAGRAGELVADGAGSLRSLLQGKAGKYAYEQASHGLLNRGVPSGKLAELDAQGGRQAWYGDAKRLGLNGRPDEVSTAAQGVVDKNAAMREAIVASNPNVQVDPAAVQAGVRAANPYPGVSRFDRATTRAAREVAGAGSDPAALDVQRAYHGNATNFSSNSPNAKLGKGIHSAINDEIEDAYNLATPGAGTQYRQAGHDMNVGMTLGKYATGSADAARATSPSSGSETLFGTAKKHLYDRFAPGAKEALYGAGAAIGDNGAAVAGAAEDLASSAPVQSSLGILGGREGAEQANQSAHVTEAALTALHGGGAELGKYKGQFAEAAGSPAPGALGVLITKLSLTDPEFRQSLLPLLRKRGGEF